MNSWAHEAGLGQGWIWCSDYGSTPVTDLFLDIRYAVSEDLPGPFYRRVFENDLGSLYETSVSGSLGYFVKTDSFADGVETEDPFAYQNALFNMMTGISDVFTPQTCDLFFGDGETLVETVSTGSPLFVYFPAGNGNASLYVNDAYRSGLFTGETDCIHYVGAFPAGDTVQIRVTDMIESCILCQLDTNRFADGLTELCEVSLSDVKNNGSVSGTVTCAADGEILTSIPDGGGWRVWVDGRRVQTVRALGTFISIPVSQGDHTITMKYSPPGTVTGAVVSSAALITLIAIKVVKKKKVY